MSIGLWTNYAGRSLHDALGADIVRARLRGPCPGMRFLPGTIFTDGELMYEVVYGVQGLGPQAGGWVAAVRTDWIDDPGAAPERHSYSLFGWQGVPRDGVIVVGGKRASILQLVAPAPRLASSASTARQGADRG